MREIPFTIRVLDPHNPKSTPPEIYEQIMNWILYVEKDHLNHYMSIEIERLFKKYLKDMKDSKNIYKEWKK